MESATVKKSCATCNKSGDVFTCRGCRQAFCAKHVDEHREKLTKEVENLAEEYELLQQEINRENEAQLLISLVNTWEQESLAKITQAAEVARTNLQEWIDRNSIEIKIPFERITNEVRACQQAEDYTETDLKRWIQQLEEFRNKMEKLPIIDMIDSTDTENIHLIKLIEPGQEQQHSSPMNQSTFTLDRTIVSFQEPPPPPTQTLLVRERFAESLGGARLFDDGLLVIYEGHWLGDSSVCGVNLYSTGTHHIRLRVLEKFYDAPFFGIITGTQKNSEHVIESISANGWGNLDFPIINGEKSSHLGRDKVIRSLDDLTLTIDCERKQIFLHHHRTKRLLHIPIDIRACPFPWKMIIVLRRRGDSVRIVGGTLSLTRENVSSRLSQRRKF